MGGPNSPRLPWSLRLPRSETPIFGSAASRASRRLSTWPGASSRTASQLTSGASAPTRLCREPTGTLGVRAPGAGVGQPGGRGAMRGAESGRSPSGSGTARPTGAR
eukprot:6219976-Alexandrium_andersonii.AAC.1